MYKISRDDGKKCYKYVLTVNIEMEKATHKHYLFNLIIHIHYKLIETYTNVFLNFLCVLILVLEQSDGLLN